MIRSSADAPELAEILAVEAERLGIRPVVLHTPERVLFETLGPTGPSNGGHVTRAEAAAIAECDGYLFVPPDPEHFNRRERLPAARRRALHERGLEWDRALVHHSVPSVFLLAAWTTGPMARHLGLDIAAWRRETFRGCTVAPRVLRRGIPPLLRRLRRGRRVRITHRNGTDLELGLLGQVPFVDDGVVDPRDLASGRVWTTLPAGTITVALDENVAEGRLISNRPSRHHRGTIQGLEWSFRNGRLDRFVARQGRRIFEETYRRAGRERDQPAMLSIGLNPEIHDFPFAEDQQQGVVTLYIGRNDDYGGRTGGEFRDYALIAGANLCIDGRPAVPGPPGKWADGSRSPAKRPRKRG